MNCQRHTRLFALVLLALAPWAVGCGGGPLPAEPPAGDAGVEQHPDAGQTGSLTGLEVGPATPTLAQQTSIALTLTASYDDGSSRDVTGEATWSSSDTAIATVSNDPGQRGRVTGVSSGQATLTGSFGGMTGTAVVTVTTATLTSLEVTPGAASIATGSSRQFHAAGIFSDGSSQDLTGNVAWASTNTQVATISNDPGTHGLATAQSVGQTTITASFSGHADSAQVTVSTVTVTGLVLTPANASIARDTTLQYTATAQLSDGTTQDVTSVASFSSSDPQVATISNTFGSRGQATGIAAGATTITATWSGRTAATGLTVTSATLSSITVLPANPALAAGFQLQFTAQGVFSDGSTQDVTTQVNWTSANAGVATISNAINSKGRATGVAAGTSTITAISGTVAGSTLLTVTQATLTSIAISPATLTLNKGTTHMLVAEGTFSDGSKTNISEQANWTSSKNNTATVSNVPGSKGMVAAGFASGVATITATASGKSGTGQVTVP